MNQERTVSDFYESRVVIKQQPDGLWIGRTRFIRKDTNEEVGRGKTLTATTREQLEECLKNATEVAMRAMPRPADWESKARLVLVRYLLLRDHITRFGGVLDALGTNSMAAGIADEKYVKFWNLLVDETVAITSAIGTLTAGEKRELLLSPDAAFANPTDPWNLDDLTGREGVYRFFTDPSEDEKQWHDQQVSRVRQVLADYSNEKER